MHATPHRHVWLVFWLSCAWYIFTASGHTYSPDEETMYAVTRAIVHTGQVNIVTDGSEAMAALRPAPIGAVAPYGIVPSLLAIPFYLVGLLLAPTAATEWDMTHLLVSLCNAPVSAGCVALLLRILMRLRLPTTSIIILTVTYALGSLTWPYARTFFSEPLTALFVLWSVDAAMTAHTQPRRWQMFMVLSGVMAGLLLPTRIAASTMIPLLGLYAIVGLPHHRIRTAIVWGLGIIPGALVFLAYNAIRYHTLFATGYSSEVTAFVNPLSIGIPGLLINPYTGLLWFVPMLVVAPIGVWYLWATQRQLVVLALSLISSQVILYASWNAWDGGGVWGPRFLVPIVPFAFILCGGIWIKSPTIATRVTLPIMGISIIINILGCAVNFSIDSNLPYPRVPPIVAHAQIAWQRWSIAPVPTQSCLVQAGWYPSEAPDGYLFQRSGASATISCRTPQFTRITLLLDDRRPTNAPSSAMTLAVNTGAPAPIPPGQLRLVRILAPTTITRIHLHNTPWNPATIGYSERNDDLGPAILAITAKPTLTAVYDASIAPIPHTYKARWAWFYHPTNRHLLDWWGWYVPHTALAPWYAWIWVGFIVCTLTLCGVAVWPRWRARTYRQPT
jgi:hypothetical protein